jgi:hypothetical protein
VIKTEKRVMADSEQRHRLANLLEQVVEGKVQSAEALKQAEKWTDMPWEGNDVNVAFHALMHFHIDADIRAQDPEYDEDLRHSLRLHISKLRGYLNKQNKRSNLPD